MSATKSRSASNVASRIALLLSVIVALLAANLAPASAANLPTNPNPIDWYFSYASDLYHSSNYENPIPFRNGQHDKAGYKDGFGKLHTQDGHEGVIPDATHITHALDGNCQQIRDGSGNVSKYECTGDGTLVIFAPQAASLDPRGCNHECDLVTGIITAYYPPN